MSDKLIKIQQIANKNKNIYEMAIVAQNVRLGFNKSCFTGDFGKKEINADSPYFIASATKLFTATLIMQMVDKGQISLKTPITEFFAPNHLDGLHVYKNVDYTDQIRVENLLAHTSGLADYFEQKQKDGKILVKDLLAGKDKSWSVEDVIKMAKNMKPAFIPNAPKRAFYSDTNYQLLGAIIEKTLGVNFATAVEQNIVIPLGLKNTWVFDINGVNANREIIPLRNGDKQLDIPLAMSSVRADGDIVSSANDGLVFIKAFFGGELFPKKVLLPMMAQWRRIFFPLQYGNGLMLFRLPSFLTLFQKQPDLVGHSGISGAFLFAEPSNEIYISGTINQLSSRSLPYNIMLKAILEMRK